MVFAGLGSWDFQKQALGTQGGFRALDFIAGWEHRPSCSEVPGMQKWLFYLPSPPYSLPLSTEDLKKNQIWFLPSRSL